MFQYLVCKKYDRFLSLTFHKFCQLKYKKLMDVIYYFKGRILKKYMFWNLIKPSQFGFLEQKRVNDNNQYIISYNISFMSHVNFEFFSHSPVVTFFDANKSQFD